MIDPMNLRATLCCASHTVIEWIAKPGGMGTHGNMQWRGGIACPQPPVESTAAARQSPPDSGCSQVVLLLVGKRVPTLTDPDDGARSHRAGERVAGPAASQKTVSGGESAVRGNFLGDRHVPDIRPCGEARGSRLRRSWRVRLLSNAGGEEADPACCTTFTTPVTPTPAFDERAGRGTAVGGRGARRAAARSVPPRHLSAGALRCHR